MLHGLPDLAVEGTRHPFHCTLLLKISHKLTRLKGVRRWTTDWWGDCQGHTAEHVVAMAVFGDYHLYRCQHKGRGRGPRLLLSNQPWSSFNSRLLFTELFPYLWNPSKLAFLLLATKAFYRNKQILISCRAKCVEKIVQRMLVYWQRIQTFLEGRPEI